MKRHQVNTKHPRYKVPNYPRGRGEGRGVVGMTPQEAYLQGQLVEMDYQSTRVAVLRAKSEAELTRLATDFNKRTDFSESQKFMLNNYVRARLPHVPKPKKRTTKKPKLKVPSDILNVYDSGDKTIDRYTVVLKKDNPHDQYNMALGLSAKPSHPQGFSQFTEASDGDHLGKNIKFHDLPVNVQKHVIERLSEN